MSSIGRRDASSTVLGSPRTGPWRYELNRELEFGRRLSSALPHSRRAQHSRAEVSVDIQMKEPVDQNLKIE